MTELLAYPFRITPGGRIATVADGSDAAHGQELQVLILTRLGERILVPAFGTIDPTFRGLDVEDVRAGVQLFGPWGADGGPIEITEVRAGPVSNGRQEVEVRFDAQGGQQ